MPPARDRTGPALRLDAVGKIYGRGQSSITALHDVTLSIPRGVFLAVMGPSGSGKSTLLHCAAGLDRPTTGKVHLGGTDLAGLDETELTKLRRGRVGCVFQAFNLVGSLTVKQNITLPLRLAGERVDRRRLADVIDRVGLSGRAAHRPAQLSGGQQQRVAIARALITRPDVVFGDEPTGALDTVTGRAVLTLLREAVDVMGQTVVMVTHDPVAASHADTVLFLADGGVVDELRSPGAERIAARMTALGAYA
jgi:putative ABC transport system ATP-binding protein